jgi:AcrR family transcriptional regulator
VSDPDVTNESRPSALSLLWSGEGVVRRGPKRAMSLASIVEAAVAIADEGGLPAVSMSAVAKQLGFTSMSLYRYITSKDDLLLLMVDAAYGPPPESLRGLPDWRESSRTWAVEIYRRYEVHPWILDVPIKGPPVTPSQLLWLEYFIEGVESSGLRDYEMLSSALMLSAYVMAQARLQRDISLNDGSEANRQFTELASILEARGTYPRVAAMIRSGMFADDDGDESFEFAFGLERILDGIEVLITKLRGSTDSR